MGSVKLPNIGSFIFENVRRHISLGTIRIVGPANAVLGTPEEVDADVSESRLDMVTTMHNLMIRRLNALDVLFKGGQKAVDEFMSSTLTGMEKLKSAALQKSKRAWDSSGPSKKRSRQGGGGSSGASSGGLSGGGQYQGGGNQGGGQHSGNGPCNAGIQCGKCRKFGHKTKDCRGL
jgi:uncharacterized membrane protein YgcG